MLSEPQVVQLFLGVALVSLDLPEQVYLQAAQLRARFGLKTPDALHLACAQYHRCDALWTNDDRLAQASQGLALRIVAN
jgi:predicted nucleic acid-binding protein